MIEIAVTESDLSLIAADLLSDGLERCAILYARLIKHADRTRLVVGELVFPSEIDYSQRTVIAAELKPSFVAQVGKRAARQGYCVLFVHSHPGDHAPIFSSTDDEGEARLAAFLRARTDSEMHASLLVSKGGWRARLLGLPAGVRLTALGANRRVHFEPEDPVSVDRSVFDRQIRAFGLSGQRQIGKLRVAIVGLGGTGSIVAQQLAHLGVQSFILVDPDVIESTNLNRVVGTTDADLGVAKITVAARQIQRIQRHGDVLSIQDTALRSAVALQMTDADFIFLCTDSHGSRAVVQQVAYQYLIPCIDVGTVITSNDGKITGIHGRAQALSPDLACLVCSGLLDSEQVRRDMLSDEERSADRYIQGARGASSGGDIDK